MADPAGAPADSLPILKSRKTRKALFGVATGAVGLAAVLAAQYFGLDDDQAKQLSLGLLALVGWLFGKDITGTATEDAAAKGKQ